jgi:23S rRNA pseudouridine2605 synthase
MTKQPEVGSGERIAKVIACAGVCSRREAERLIAEGRVRLDGKVLDSPAVTVGPGAAITVNGKPLPRPERPRLWRYHKPPGLITTARDPQGRPTVFDSLPADLPRVLAVGRLDLTSEGLLLLTNDGGLKRRLELPDTGWTRRYRVRVHGQADPAALAALSDGVTVSGIRYAPVQAVLERQQGANAWVSVALKEGKNREVRRVMEHLGLDVNRLIRVAYGPFQLGRLPAGALAEVPAKVLREQLSGESPVPTGTAKPKAKPARPAASAGRSRKPGKRHANRRRPS